MFALGPSNLGPLIAVPGWIYTHVSLSRERGRQRANRLDILFVDATAAVDVS